MKLALRLLLALSAITAAPAGHADENSAEFTTTDARAHDGALIPEIASKLTESLAEAPLAGTLPIEKGLASYYARRFHGSRTASGETLRHDSLIAAHPTFPLGTIARVTNLATGRSIEVRIADRGPAPSRQSKGVIIDLSRAAARHLDMIRAGLVRVSVEVLEWGQHRKSVPTR